MMVDAMKCVPAVFSKDARAYVRIPTRARSMDLSSTRSSLRERDRVEGGRYHRERPGGRKELCSRIISPIPHPMPMTMMDDDVRMPIAASIAWSATNV